MVKSITAVSKPFPDGQRVVAVRIEYEEKIEANVSKDAFEVRDRTVTGVCVEGNVVTVELYPKDPIASTLIGPDGSHVDMPRPPMPRQGGPRTQGEPGPQEGPRPQGGPGPQGGQGQQGGPRPQGGPPEMLLPDGRKFRGPAGMQSSRWPVLIWVCQKEDIEGENGIIKAWNFRKNDNEDNGVADLFRQCQFEDITYNIFVPEDYDATKKYPILLFIHDAGTSGQSPRVTLEQGIGATIWATPEEQKKHPCIVVAPQHSKFYPIANDNYWCFDDMHTYKRLLDYLQREYSVDESRIYTTGQSMGFMTSIALMLEYPGYFTAALLPAGHWDIEKTATLWKEKIWMFLSEDDRGGRMMIENLPGAIEKLGGQMSVYTLDANQPTEELSKFIDSVKDEGENFKMTIFPHETIERRDQSDRTDGGAHAGTWHLVYMIEAARDWLFEQKKG